MFEGILLRSATVLALVATIGCGSTDAPTSSDAASDDAADADTIADGDAATTGGDAAIADGCPVPESIDTLGDTCASFGPGAPCGACGLPAYGYVCSGGRPDADGCVRAAPENALGTATYCCAELRCVRAPALDAQCPSSAKMVQCPEDESGALLVEPGVGCTKSTQPPPYQWFCCP